MPTSQQIAELKAKLQNVIFEKEPDDTVVVLTAPGNRIGLMQRSVAERLTSDGRFADDFALQGDSLVVFQKSKRRIPKHYPKPLPAWRVPCTTPVTSCNGAMSS